MLRKFSKPVFGFVGLGFRNKSERGSQSVGARAYQTGILRGSAGCLKGLTEMTEEYRIWVNQISHQL